MKYKVGDRVRYIASQNMSDPITENNPLIDMCLGTVVALNARDPVFSYGVRFDHAFLNGHSLQGLCDDGYGWMCLESSLEPAVERDVNALYDLWKDTK